MQSPRGSKSKPENEFERDRARLDKKKLARERKMHWAHFWDLCPKCGGDMFEQNVLKIRFEVCRKCNGIYIDHQELSLALKHLDPLKWLRAALRRAKSPKVP